MFNTLKTCFSKEAVNTGRQTEVDVAKGFAILFMVICHVLGYFSHYDNKYTTLLLGNILGGPFAAPVFMFCMGIGICYSKRNQSAYLFRRGCHLLAAGLFLQIFRKIIPTLILTYAKEKTISAAVVSSTFLYNLSTIDILQFSGVFFMIFALFRKWELSLLQLNILSVIFSVMGYFLSFCSPENYLAGALLGFFSRCHEDSCFPFLNWYFFPVAGYTLGHLWKRCCDKKTVYRTVTPACWLLTALYLGFLLLSGNIYNSNHYYTMCIDDAIPVAILVIAVLGSGYFLSLRLPQVAKGLCWLSEHITSIYCTHWILITQVHMILKLALGRSLKVSDLLILPLSFLFLIVSCWLADIYTKFSKRTGRMPG